MRTLIARFNLTALFIIGLLSFPGIAAHAATATVAVGQPLTLAVTVNGTAPFTYQWSKDSAALSGATGSTYVISGVQPADAGVYNVFIANSAGSITSDNAILTVSSVAIAPAITTQPAVKDM